MSSHDPEPVGSERGKEPHIEVTDGMQIPGTSTQQQEIGSSERQSASLKYSKEHSDRVKMQMEDKGLSPIVLALHSGIKPSSLEVQGWSPASRQNWLLWDLVALAVDPTSSDSNPSAPPML